MTIQTIMQDPTDAALLAQLDAILVEVQKLRTTLQTRHAVPKRIDYVAQLSGALGPAAPDELEFFRAHDLDWERFAS
jgi:hypothetical protein